MSKMSCKFITDDEGTYMLASDVADLLDAFPEGVGTDTAADIRKKIIEQEKKYRAMKK